MAKETAESFSDRRWAEQQELSYEDALGRYYRSGSRADHDECLRRFGAWMAALRGFSYPTYPHD